MAITKSSIKGMTGLWRVRSKKMLLWPKSVMSSNVTHLNGRGKPGYVVDLDLPYEKNLCTNMERFLEKVPKGQEDAAREKLVDPYDFPRPVQNHLIEAGLLVRRAMKRPPTRKQQMAERAAAQAKPTSTGAPALDAPPKGGRTRRSRGGADDAGEGEESAPQSE